MSYNVISVKEALERINTQWFLPAIQRPYVWGNRYGSETYICKLFDSLFRGYPIGALIVWNTQSSVNHREFLHNYTQGLICENVPQTINNRNKGLIYDGQQRLQTLYSCLKYRFDNKILIFDLLYNKYNDEDNTTGFRFVTGIDEMKTSEIALNTICECTGTTEQKISQRLKYTKDKTAEEQTLIETNFDQLWYVFATKEQKSLAYFSIDAESEDVVNEIFQRLNTGGMPLNNSDLLFSKIKAKYPNFEIELIKFSQKIKKTGLDFNAYDILQLLNLLVKQQIRVDGKVSDAQINQYQEIWLNSQDAILDFFVHYLKEYFNIDNNRIIKSKMPLFILLAYFYRSYLKNHKYRKFSPSLQKTLNQFFIISETNEWFLQSYIDNFLKIIDNAFTKENLSEVPFPLEEIKEFVRNKGNRSVEINRTTFENNRLFSLKILLRDRPIDFLEIGNRRYEAQIDHIFPTKLAGMEHNSEYQNEVNVLWNFQPVIADINNEKSNHHPLDFFTDKVIDIQNEKRLHGSRYFEHYDCVPDLTSTKWLNHKNFINYRKTQLIQKLKDNYDIDLVDK